MKLLDRHIIREFGAPFAAGTVLFIAVILVNTIVASSATIFSLNPPWRVIAQWLALRIPIVLTFALPVGCMLATSLLIIRLGRDSEITAWRMGGTSVRRIFRPFYLLGLLVSAFALINNEFVAPQYRLRANQVLLDRILQGPGSWIKDDMPLRAGDDAVAHVGRVDLQRKELYSVLIYTFRAGRPQEALSAPLCVQRDGRWYLQNGRRNWFDEDGRLTRTERFDEAPVAFATDLASMWEEENEPEQMTARELYRRMKLHQAAGDRLNEVRMRYFFWAKFTMPLTSLVFVLLAAPLSLRFAHPASHPLAGVLLTIVVIFFCNGTINWAKVIALSSPNAWLPPTLAAWLHILVFGTLALLLARDLDH